MVRPIPGPISTLKLRARFPASRIVVVEHHRRTPPRPTIPSPFEEATVLTLDRGGDFRCGSRWQARGTAPDARTGAVLSRFARRSLRPRHRAAGLSGQRRRAQGAVALGRRRRPLSRSVPRNPATSRGRAAHRPLVFLHRAAAAAAASARASTNAWGCRTAPPLPEPLRAHVAAGIQRAVEDARRSAWRAAAGIFAWPAGWD